MDSYFPHPSIHLLAVQFICFLEMWNISEPEGGLNFSIFDMSRHRLALCQSPLILSDSG